MGKSLSPYHRDRLFVPNNNTSKDSAVNSASNGVGLNGNGALLAKLEGIFTCSEVYDVEFVYMFSG